jgi:hypothetical protein
LGSGKHIRAGENRKETTVRKEKEKSEGKEEEEVKET